MILYIMIEITYFHNNNNQLLIDRYTEAIAKSKAFD